MLHKKRNNNRWFLGNSVMIQWGESYEVGETLFKMVHRYKYYTYCRTDCRNRSITKTGYSDDSLCFNREVPIKDVGNFKKSEEVVNIQKISIIIQNIYVIHSIYIQQKM